MDKKSDKVRKRQKKKEKMTLELPVREKHEWNTKRREKQAKIRKRGGNEGESLKKKRKNDECQVVDYLLE